MCAKKSQGGVAALEELSGSGWLSACAADVVTLGLRRTVGEPPEGQRTQRRSRAPSRRRGCAQKGKEKHHDETMVHCREITKSYNQNSIEV